MKRIGTPGILDIQGAGGHRIEAAGLRGHVPGSWTSLNHPQVPISGGDVQSRLEDTEESDAPLQGVARASFALSAAIRSSDFGGDSCSRFVQDLWPDCID